MPNDQRILDIIAAASEKKPADVAEPFNALVGERIAELVAARRDQISSTFFGEPEDEAPEIDADHVHEATPDTGAGAENDQDA